MTRLEALQFLNAAHFFVHFFLLIFPTAALAIAPAWGVTYASTLALSTPLFVCFALGTPIAGWLGDRVDRLGLIAVFFVLGGGAACAIGLSNGQLSMMVGLGVLGFACAIFHPVGLAMLPDLSERVGRTLAINGVFGNMGLAAAAVITGFLADHFGWQTAFIVPGILSTLIGIALLVRRRTGAPDLHAERSTKSSYRGAPRLVQIAVFAFICTAALFGGLIFNVVTISLPAFLQETMASMQGNLTMIGASAGAVFAVAAFAQLPVGELLDRFGARRLLTALMVLQAVLLLLSSMVSGEAALVVSLLLVTTLFAQLPITGWLLGRFVPSQLRARAFSAEYVLSLGMGSAAVPAIAIAHSMGLNSAMQFGILAVAAIVVLFAVPLVPADLEVSRQRRRDRVSTG